jgi:nitrite reductase/ring-hydroxylating ferredoxin subunit
MNDVNRRDFVLTVAGVLGAACAGCLCSSAEAAPTSQSTKPVDVGPKSEFSKDGIVNDKFASSEHIIVVRTDGEIYALNNTCPHKGKPVKPKDGELFCPSHGSHFSVQGAYIKGPAKRSLTRYAISVNDKGHLIVDKSKQFEEKKWDDASSFVKA